MRVKIEFNEWGEVRTVAVMQYDNTWEYIPRADVVLQKPRDMNGETMLSQKYLDLALKYNELADRHIALMAEVIKV